MGLNSSSAGAELVQGQDHYVSQQAGMVLLCDCEPGRRAGLLSIVFDESESWTIFRNLKHPVRNSQCVRTILWCSVGLRMANSFIRFD